MANKINGFHMQLLCFVSGIRAVGMRGNVLIELEAADFSSAKKSYDELRRLDTNHQPQISPNEFVWFTSTGVITVRKKIAI